jgi:hypothetical protein
VGFKKKEWTVMLGKEFSLLLLELKRLKKGTELKAIVQRLECKNNDDHLFFT